MNKHASKPAALFSYENIPTDSHIQTQSYLYFHFVFIVESLRIYPKAFHSWY